MTSYFGKPNNGAGFVDAGPTGLQYSFPLPLRDPIVCLAKDNNAMHVKSVILGVIETIRRLDNQPVLYFEPFKLFLENHILRSNGKISDVDSALQNPYVYAIRSLSYLKP